MKRNVKNSMGMMKILLCYLMVLFGFHTSAATLLTVMYDPSNSNIYPPYVKGGTNFPNINLLVGSTNLSLSSGVRKAYHNQTNGNHGINLNLAIPESGYEVVYSVSNSSSSAIMVSLYSNSVQMAVYDINTKTNVNSFAAGAASLTKIKLTYASSGLWILDQFEAPKQRIIWGSGLTTVTNGENGLDITVSSSGGVGTMAFNVTNITVITTNEVVADVGNFDVVKILLLTNLNTLTLSNVSTMTERSQIFFQQDTNGQRFVLNNRVAGGLIQTNANLQPTTNANALDLLEVMPGLFTSNAVVWWPQNFQPRVAFTNSLDDGAIACSADGQSFLTINGVSGSGSIWFASAFVSDGQDICSASLNIAKSASETSDFFLEIYSNAATNVPGTLLGTSATVPVGSVGTATNYVQFTFPTVISTANLSTNWFVLRKAAATGFSVTMGRASGSANMLKESGDGVNWAIVSATRQVNYTTLKP